MIPKEPRLVYLTTLSWDIVRFSFSKASRSKVLITSAYLYFSLPSHLCLPWSQVTAAEASRVFLGCHTSAQSSQAGEH